MIKINKNKTRRAVSFYPDESLLYSIDRLAESNRRSRSDTIISLLQKHFPNNNSEEVNN